MERWNVRKLFSGRNFTWLLLLLILVFNFSIRWRLRELPLERDEGEYAYAGQLILQAIPPYQMAWNMKFPGAYLAYAGLMKVFGESPAGIHDGLILVTSVGIVLVFLIGRRLLNDAGGVLAAALFAQLCALPQTSGLACHVTHFVNVFVSLAVYALLRRENSRPLLWTAVAGLALGSALLMTQQAWFFGAAAGIWLLCRTRSHLAVALRQGAVFTSALILPLVLVALWLDRAGVWDRFYLWTIQYAREYAGTDRARAIHRWGLAHVHPGGHSVVAGFDRSTAGFPVGDRPPRCLVWCRLAHRRSGRDHPGFLFPSPLLPDGHARHRPLRRRRYRNSCGAHRPAHFTHHAPVGHCRSGFGGLRRYRPAECCSLVFRHSH
jgi:hypothetical protein